MTIDFSRLNIEEKEALAMAEALLRRLGVDPEAARLEIVGAAFAWWGYSGSGRDIQGFRPEKDEEGRGFEWISVFYKGKSGQSWPIGQVEIYDDYHLAVMRGRPGDGGGSTVYFRSQIPLPHLERGDHEVLVIGPEI